MPDDRWQRVKELFAAAWERPPEARGAYLHEACGGDEGLRREVESLLDAGGEAGDFLSEAAPVDGDGTPSTRLAPGTRLGPYEVVSFVGAGGMGEVYKARDTRLGRTVAIKVLASDTVADRDLARRFEREARTISQLSHPHICALYDVGQHDGSNFLVMEYLEGETLAERLRKGPLPLDEALDYAIQIADALEEAHQHGVVHRDLKPANVVLTKKGAKLLDFGIAKLRATVPADEESSAQTLTREGLVIGTLQYMAPEQLEGKPVDERTDIFAFGVVLYEMVSGRRAFEARSGPALIAAILKSEPPALSHIQPVTPPSLDVVVRRCLAKEPSARWASAGAVVSALRSVRQGAPLTLEPPRTSRAAAFGRRHAFAALALAAVAAVVWAAMASRREAGSRSSIDSLAVLPFAVSGGDADSEYLGDGLAESVINTLASVPDLRVAARTSAFRYKGREEPPQTISRELGVSGLLTGRVAKRGPDLIVQVDLVDGQQGSQLWGQRYSRPLTDLLVLQEEIARDVAARLRVQLGRAGEQNLASSLTADPEADRLYLLARFYANQRTRDAMTKALDHYMRAAERDPAFALAHAGVAEANSHLMASFGALAPRDGYPAAKAAATRAFELAPDRAEVRTQLAFLAMSFEADWDRAEREFRRALELDPNYDLARQWYAYALVALGRGDEAVAQIREAERRDPASFVTTLDGCLIDFYARRYEEGIAQCQRVLDMRPNDGFGRWLRVFMYSQTGRMREADAELAAALRAATSAPRGMALAVMISHYVQSGRRDEAAALVREEEAKTPVTRAYSRAQMYAVIGDTDRALDMLERSFVDRDPILVNIGGNPFLDPVRSHPRFRALTRRIGLPDAAPVAKARPAAP